MEWYLPVIWAGVIGTAVAMYVVLDGFDLGIGVLFPFARSEGERDQMMRSVAPFWDGNETWLVLGGAGLFVAFPRAYAVVMPAFYLPVIVMLLALVFRGIAFEFRTVSHSKTWWSVVFTGGSTLAGFAQGVILGGLIEGVPVRDGAYAGGPLHWATPFAFVCGLALVAGYALLGATWLAMKTEGPVAVRSRGQAKWLLLAVLAFMAAVSLWTPLAEPRIAARWFSLPNFYFLWPVPVVTALVAFLLWRWLEQGPRGAAVPGGDRAIHAGLSRAGDFKLPLSGAALAHHLGYRRRAGEPDFHAARHVAAFAVRDRLRGDDLLAVPRQGARRRTARMPISVPPMMRR